VEVVDPGLLTSRRHLNVRGKSATLPAITDKDWLDLAFGVEVGVDFYALSFVKDARVIYEVKRWLMERGSKIKVLAKIESADRWAQGGVGARKGLAGGCGSEKCALLWGEE
jgi:pyruvate kinase